MTNLTTTLCLTIAVLLGSAGVRVMAWNLRNYKSRKGINDE